MSKASDDNVHRVRGADVPAPTRADLDRLRAINDDDIDLSDIPELTEEELARMRKPIVLHLAPELRNWLLAQPHPDEVVGDLIRERLRKAT